MIQLVSYAIAAVLVFGPVALATVFVWRALCRRFGTKAVVEALAIGALPGGLIFLAARLAARLISEPRRTA